MKSHKVLWSFFGIFLVASIISSLLLINPFSNTILGPNEGFDNSEFLVSNYVAKVGLTSGLNENLFGGGYNGLNELTSKLYGYIIFNTPVILTSQLRDELMKEMIQANRLSECNYNRYHTMQTIVGNTNCQNQYAKYFPTPIFSQNLIAIVNRNSFTFNDLAAIDTELETSVNTFCTGILTMNSDTGISGRDLEDLQVLVSICQQKPSQILKRDGSSYVLNTLPDVKIYKAKTNMICSQTMPTSTPVGSSCYAASAVEGPDNTRITTYCCNIPTGEKELVGTIKLSNIKMKFSEKAGSLVVALNDAGITNADSVPPRFQFEQYAFYTDHNNSASMDKFDYSRNGGFIVLSNSQSVIDASNGKIDKTNKLSDLWFGIKSGKAITSPHYLIMLSLTGISYLGLLIFGLVLTAMAITKK